MSQNFTISKIIRDKPAVNQEKRNKDKKAIGYQNQENTMLEKSVILKCLMTLRIEK